MTKTVEFLFDFGSPNAYLSHRVVPAIEARTGVRFVYVPVLLGGLFKLTNNQPPAVAFGNIKNKLPYEMLETRRFIARHNLTAFVFNPHFPVNTLQLMRGAAAAVGDGVSSKYVEAIFQCMWERSKKMDDPDVFRAALRESGLDADHLIARAQDQDVKDTLLANTQRAFARGAFGIPTFFVGDEMYFGKDRLRDVEEEIVRR
ncbi:MAG: 2-hydroxychromene-2-carboxylate isomerase [Deltaproteobacteria bacterium]|nr:2-hydroxychromene-2-carboxylate isomerase [Deltaproteobacteria bacterium]